MTVFQIIGLAVAVLFVGLNLRRLVRRPESRMSALAWISIGLLGAYAIHDPDSTTRFAGLMGVRRGADLLLYVGTLCGIAAFFYVCLRLRQIDRGITAVVRRMAIQHAVIPDPEGAEAASFAVEYDVEEPIP